MVSATTELGITTLDRISHLKPVESRDCGLGGSDLAAILQMSPWANPFDVWAKKTGALKEVRREDVRKKWGRRLERVIAEAYGEETGTSIHWFDRTLQNPQLPFQILTPDAFVLEKPIGLDAKTAGADQAWKFGDTGTADIPDVYAVQMSWYLSATKLDQWDVACLFGGSDLRIYTILPDPEIEAVLLEEAEKFWRTHIIGGVAPEIGATEGAKEYLRQRFPRAIGDVREADLEEHALAAEWRRVADVLAAAKKHEEELGNQIKNLIGADAGMKFEDGAYLTWNEQTRKSYTVQETTFRVLRYHKARKGKAK